MPDTKSNNPDTSTAPQVKYTCTCHCGATCFTILHEALESTSPSPSPVVSCNCSICDKNGYLLIYVYRTEIEHIRGWDNLVKYRFASKTRDHLFCGVCGTSVGIDYQGCLPKGDLVGINARIIQGVNVRDLNTYNANGRDFQSQYNRENA